ncbi:MAG: ABC transporter permease [Pyrinomonadaceae bacterium]
MAGAKPMLARIKFPRESIILAKLGEVLFNFGIKMILLVAMFLWFQIPTTRMLLLAPLALISLIMLGTVLGLFLAPIAVLYQDIARGLAVFTGLWLFLTPVVYPLPHGGLFGTLVRLNPVTPLLVTTREMATTGIISDFQQFLLVSAFALIALIPAWLMYRLAMPFVIERVSS